MMEFPVIRRVATPESLTARWRGQSKGFAFRCHLCGHRFEVGDEYFILITTNGLGIGNPLICSNCNTKEAPRKWLLLNIELYERFWWEVDLDDWKPEDRVAHLKKKLALLDAESPADFPQVVSVTN